MQIKLVSGCINDWLGIDNIREVEMTEEQRRTYFNEISKKLPELDSDWFNQFLQWICEEYGEYEYSDKPCESCGDYTITYKLNI